MVYQPKLADMFTIDSVVPTLKRNAMIPHFGVSVYRLVQLTITVIAIHLELVGFHEGLGFLAFISVSVEVGAPTMR